MWAFDLNIYFVLQQHTQTSRDRATFSFIFAILTVFFVFTSSESCSAQNNLVVTGSKHTKSQFGELGMRISITSDGISRTTNSAKALFEQLPAIRDKIDLIKYRLKTLEPKKCNDTSKLSWNGATWICLRDLLGCEPETLSLHSDRYQCSAYQRNARMQGRTGDNLQCTGSSCVGGEQRCIRYCYQECNCRQVCKGFGRHRTCDRVCDSCPYDCSYTVCLEMHTFICEGQYKCDKDKWHPEAMSCKTLTVSRTGC